jgi:hypothetical protein
VVCVMIRRRRVLKTRERRKTRFRVPSGGNFCGGAVFGPSTMFMQRVWKAEHGDTAQQLLEWFMLLKFPLRLV